MRKTFLRSILMGLISLVVTVASVASSVTSAAFVSALSEQQKYIYGQNNILFYDPQGRNNNCGPSFNLSGVQATGDYNDNAIYIMAYLLSEGYSAEAVAAIMGNLKGEGSTFNPGEAENGYADDVNDSAWRLTPSWTCYDRCGFGIAQWTSGGRQLALQAFADEHGMPVTSLELQTMFLAHELKTSQRYPQYGGFGTTKMNSLTIEEGVWQIYRYYETPASSYAIEYRGEHYNDYDPVTFDMLDPVRTRKAYEVYTLRLGYAKGALQVIVDNNLAAVAAGGSSSTSAGQVDGNKVTLIGDSISNDTRTRELLRAAMSGIDIQAKDSKQFYGTSSDNPTGIQIVREMAANNTLREIVVIELGTNGAGTVTQDRIREMLEVIGPNRKVVFVTNYGVGYNFESNNLAMTWARDTYPNQVSIADWEAVIEPQPRSYLDGMGVHPNNDEARRLYVNLIKDTLSGMGTASAMASSCSPGAVNGGLSESQAQRLADYYNGPEVVASEWGFPMDGRKTNCVAFSLFFVKRFTSWGKNSLYTGDGRQVVYYMAQGTGQPTGSAPRPYSVFAVTEGVSWCTAANGAQVKCGHTGIVVAVNGNDIITVEASWPSTPAYVTHRDISYFTNAEFGNSYVFMYLDNILDRAELAQVVGN